MSSMSMVSLASSQRFNGYLAKTQNNDEEEDQQNSSVEFEQP